MQVTLCLTHDCTLRCPYCYAGTKRRKAMPWEVAKAEVRERVLALQKKLPALMADLASRAQEAMIAEADVAGLEAEEGDAVDRAGGGARNVEVQAAAGRRRGVRGSPDRSCRMRARPEVRRRRWGPQREPPGLLP